MEVHILFLLFASFWCAIGAQVIVLSASPTAHPGDAFNIQGANFQAGSVVYLSSSTFSSLSIRVVNEGNQLITAQLPSNIPFDKYSLVVQSGGQTSNAFEINAATALHSDSLHVGSGATFRVFGRNLYVTGSSPQASLQDSNGNFFACSVDLSSSTPFVLALQAPSSLQGSTDYVIWVTNGLGGSWSPLVATQLFVTAINSNTDVYSLNVPWHGFFKDNQNNRVTLYPGGNLDDADMIRNALFSVTAPGEVYLSAGLYGLTNGIAIPSGVVLRGAGADQTTILYNHKYNTMTGGAGWVWFNDNGENLGIADLTFTNSGTYAVNGETNPLQVGQNIKRAFLKGLKWYMNITKHAYFSGIEEMTITDCTFTLLSTPSQNGNLWCANSNHAIFKNNEVTYDTWGIHFIQSDGVVIENNNVHRNADLGFLYTTHGLPVSWTSNLYFANNNIDVINGELVYNNDGETLLTEGGGADRGDIGASLVSYADSFSLTDTTQNWATFTTNPYVAIVNGPGLGQYRRIVSNTANTLTIDRAWDIVPTSASSYSFGPVAANWTVYQNTFTNQERGMWMYMSYMYDVAIDSNHLVNSEGISIIAYTADSNGAGSPVIATWLYGVQITNNYLSWNPTETDARATYIGINHDQARQDPVGVIVLSTEIRGNTIVYLGGGTRADYSDDYSMYDGYQAKVTNQGSSLSTFPPSVIGTIFQDNTIDSFYSGLVLGESVSQTTVAFLHTVSCTYEYRNVTINRNDEPYTTDENRATISDSYNI
eukprot:Phypoly_transcript_03340.p1 GENE.Phypoly_transcript_03340~~Phypoly_transcript_03340.p1  ORF type:complete len:765 (+),score=91.18 Phypoly_transcript_03340:124-2418(+)